MVLAPDSGTATESAADVTAEPAGADAPDATPPAEGGEVNGVRQIDSTPAEPVDLFDVAGSSVARRLLRPAFVVGALVLVATRVRRHRRR